MVNYGLMSEFQRPNRLIDEKGKRRKKDGKGVEAEDYHRRMGRWAASHCINDPRHREFVMKSLVFWRFYEGDQWILDDDLENFMIDESGFSRNRLKVVENIVKPMIKQYVGNAIGIEYNAKVVNISPFAKNRRELELGRAKFMSRMANQVPEFSENIKRDFGVGRDEQETEEIFNNSYVDSYTKTMNRLVKFNKEKHNDFIKNRIALAKQAGITGLSIHRWDASRGQMRWKVTDSLFYLFDRGAEEQDLSDVQCEGELMFATAPEIFERYQGLGWEEKKAIENYSTEGRQNYGHMYYLFFANSDRIPYFDMYWQDTDEGTYGFVFDNYGYEQLVQIDSEGNDYTKNDLIEPKEGGNREFLGLDNGNKDLFVKKYDDVLRYCKFIPSEVISRMDGGDIVLEYGKMPYQEHDILDSSVLKSPFKKWCTDYHLGKITSPLEDVLDPQRLLNRTLSITESQMNNARGTGIVYDTSLLGDGGEEELVRNMNLSKPVGLAANRSGINNAVGAYGTNLQNQLKPFADMAQLMRVVAQNTTGVNEAMKGTGQGSNKLVGVQQLEIQRGSLIQEEFYAGLNHIMLETFQAILTSGKRIYFDNPRKLAMAVGDEGVETIRITLDMMAEDFRAFLQRTEPDESRELMANQQLLQLLQFGLLSDKQVAELWNRGNDDLVSEKLREYYSIKQRLAKKQAEAEAAAGQAEQQESEQLVQQLKAEKEKDRVMQMEEKDKSRQHDAGMAVLNKALEGQDDPTIR